MNQQQFESIQERWAKASSGPWTVQPPMKPTESVVEINTYEAAAAAGVVKSKDEWIRSLEEGLTKDQDAFECDAMERMGAVYAIPPRLLIGRRDAADKAMLRDDHKVDEPVPSFLVSAQAKPDDVVFVRTAVEDMGSLLLAYEARCEEVHGLCTERSALRVRLSEVEAQTNDLRLKLARLCSALATIRALVPSAEADA